MADFKKSIESLRNRSKRSRLAVTMIGLSILTIVLYSFTFVAYRYTKKPDVFEVFAKGQNQDIKTNNKVIDRTNEFNWSYQKGISAESLFNNRIEQVLEDSLGRDAYQLELWLFTSKPHDKMPIIKADYDPKILEAKLNPILSAYERYSVAQKSQFKNELSTQKTDYQSIISSLLLSFGVLAFVILMIQTAVTFMRYYARLAELYDAQADALEASEGDPETAYHFIEKFSPLGVEFGKLPTTLYEKSFDTIIEIAKSKK